MQIFHFLLREVLKEPEAAIGISTKRQVGCIAWEGSMVPSIQVTIDFLINLKKCQNI